MLLLTDALKQHCLNRLFKKAFLYYWPRPGNSVDRALGYKPNGPGFEPLRVQKLIFLLTKSIHIQE